MLNFNGYSNTFETFSLPYNYDALEPYIDKETLTIQHEKIEQAYIYNLNSEIINVPLLQNKTVEEILINKKVIPKNLREKILFSAGGIYNHNFFWNSISPEGGGNPRANIEDAIITQFGSLDNFKREFEAMGLNLNSSGWIWLLSDNKGNLLIKTTLNESTPLETKYTPILALDLWEHAYYLKYQNRREEYLHAYWNIVNWEFAEANFLNSFKK